jgi:DNA (cytosine-5)-methyltransferase 1
MIMDRLTAMTASTTRPIHVIDLFAGCGGFTQGFREFRTDSDLDSSPFRTVGAVEWDVAAASTYAANFAEEAGGVGHIFAGDIKDWSPEIIQTEVDVILGGPPCQGFSGLGKEDAADPRNKLWREYVRVVKALNPKVFVIENVDRFFRSPEYSALEEVTQPGAELGNYHLEKKILNAADYGVPQARRRAIVLATRRDLIGLHPEHKPLTHPTATHQKQRKNSAAGQLSVGEILPPWVSINGVFRGTPNMTATSELPDGRDAPLGTMLPGLFKTTDLHIGRNPTQLSLDRYAAIPPGGNRHDLPPHLSTESWMNHHAGSGDVMGRMHWDHPSVTIRTEFYKPEKGRYLHPFADRPITHLEAALLQGFPKSFLWCGSKVQIARQIGNAVPVGLSRVIAGQLYSYVKATEQSNAPIPKEATSFTLAHQLRTLCPEPELLRTASRTAG